MVEKKALNHNKLLVVLLAGIIGLLIIIEPSMALIDCCVDTSTNICREGQDIASCDGTLYQGSLCVIIPECQTGCCCATPAAPNPDMWNAEETNMLMTQLACSSPTFGTPTPYNWLPINGSCIATCGGAGSGGTPGGEVYTVDGTIKDHTGANLEGAIVSVPYSGTNSATTDENGYYVISGVPAMSTNVFATKQGCTPTYSSTVSIDEDTTINFAINCEQQACTPGIPRITAVPVQGDDSARLTISFDDECEQLVEYVLIRNNNIVLTTTQEEYIDEGLLQETEYCWKVAANLGGSLHPATQDARDEACITTGAEACMHVGDNIEDLEWCDNSAEPNPLVLHCDDENHLVEKKCTDNRVCGFVGTGDDRRRDCVSQPPCEKCNGVFGLLKRFVFAIFYNGATTQCNSADLDGYCFEDRTTTTTDKLRACGEITTCEDYLSLDACQENPCEVPDDCDWLGVYNELGLGVCQATDAPAACDACDRLFGTCNEYLCESIGDRGGAVSDCYWDANDNGLQYPEDFGTHCIHKDKMACRYYDTQTDCTNGGANVVVDATYDSALLRTGGTHALTTASADQYNIGLCAWEADLNFDSGGFCYKNADNKPSEEAKDDCRESGAFLTHGHECLRDNEAPSTELILPSGTIGQHELAFLDYVVRDNLFDDEDIQTRFCVRESGQTCYPQETIAAAVAGIDLDVGEDNSFVIRYYSWDPAGNLEPVQERTAQIINLGYPILAGAELR